MQSHLALKSIGIFDSGLGGLTVLRAIREILPFENILYFGDTAHLPYGNKSKEAICRYSLESATFLVKQGIKALVIACNTSCSAALDPIREQFNIPVIGIVEQGADEIARRYTHGKIAILGTRATIASGIYEKLLKERGANLECFSIACPLFVPLVEEGYTTHSISAMAVHEYLKVLKQEPIQAALLGCTHYPMLSAFIQQEVGNHIPLIDPAEACAKTTYTCLKEHQLLNTQTLPGYTRFFVSNDPEKFRLLGRSFLNHPIEHVYEQT